MVLKIYHVQYTIKNWTLIIDFSYGEMVKKTMTIIGYYIFPIW
jgi:hypothetical protein